MADYNEKPFENEICEHLAANGWLYSTERRRLRPRRGRCSPRTCSAGWRTRSRTSWPRSSSRAPAVQGEAARAAARPPGEGAGHADGARRRHAQRAAERVQAHVRAKFAMCQFRPDTDAEPDDRRAVRQGAAAGDAAGALLAAEPAESIDLVLFVNGLPVATLELKTDFTQTVDDAIEQYRTTGSPRPGERVEPLLGFGTARWCTSRCRTTRCWMTTRLAGAGHRLPAVQPGQRRRRREPAEPERLADGVPVGAGAAARHLAGHPRQVHAPRVTERRPTRSPARRPSRTTLLFPRFHQWDVVTAARSTPLAPRGPGTGT